MSDDRLANTVIIVARIQELMRRVERGETTLDAAAAELGISKDTMLKLYWQYYNE